MPNNTKRQIWKPPVFIRNAIAVMVLGALLAPACLFLLSYLRHDETLRAMHVLIAVSATGAVGSRVVFEMFVNRSKSGWRLLLMLPALLVYILFVYTGFIIARLGLL